MQLQKITKCITDKDPSSIEGMLKPQKNFESRSRHDSDVHPFKQCLAVENRTDFFVLNISTKELFYDA
jgi:hypothetical protein